MAQINYHLILNHFKRG